MEKSTGIKEQFANRRIETVQDIMKWAELVNTVRTPQITCDLQDVFMHGEVGTLKELFCGELPNRKLVLFAMLQVLDYDVAQGHLLEFYKRKAHKIVDEQSQYYADEYTKKVRGLDSRYEEIQAKEIRFAESKKPIYKKLADLRKRNAYLERRLQEQDIVITNFEDQRNFWRGQAKENSLKANKFDSLQKLLKEE